MKKAVFIMLSAIITTSVIAQSGNENDQAIAKVVNTMETGWVQKNGQQFASVFAEEHDFIVWNGYYFKNSTPKSIGGAHQALFDGVFKTFDIRLKVDKIRYLRPDIAVVHVLGGGYQKGESIPENPGVLMSMVMEKKDGSWKIVSFHNLDLETFQNKDIENASPMPLKVMYAGWYKK
jgi:uncharacterized protein (TIGR02246 family)